MNRQDLIDRAHALRAKIEREQAGVDTATFWRMDRAYWLAARALDRLGAYGLLSRKRLDWHIEQCTWMIAKMDGVELVAAYRKAAGVHS